MQSLQQIDDPDTFDRCVGPSITTALKRLETIEHELAAADQGDSVAAMTLTMKLQDERDELHAAIAVELVRLRSRLG